MNRINRMGKRGFVQSRQCGTTGAKGGIKGEEFFDRIYRMNRIIYGMENGFDAYCRLKFSAVEEGRAWAWVFYDAG